MARGDIYYSPRAKRFYQEGRRGAVSRDFGVRSLRYDPESDIFVDSRGRTIDKSLLGTETRSTQRFTAQDESGRVFVSAETRSRAISEQQAKAIRLNSNQDITVRTVVTTPDGRTHVFTRSYGFGKNIDPAEAKELAAKQARAALLNTKGADGKNYQLSTPTVKNRTVRQDFYVRTVYVR